MFNLDIATLRLCALIVVIGTLGALAAFWRNKKTTPSVNTWLIGILCYTVSFLCGLFRAELPWTFVSVVIDLGIVASSTLFLNGVRLNLRMTSLYWLTPTLFVLTLLVSLVFNYLILINGMRMLLVSLLVGGLSAWTSALLFRSGGLNWHSANCIGAISFLLYTLYNLARAGYVLTTDQFALETLRYSFLASCLFIAAIVFTFILMAYEHLQADLDRALETLRVESRRKLEGLSQRWLHAQEVGNAGAWELNLANNMLTLSGQWVRLVGLDADEISIPLDQLRHYLHHDDVTPCLEALRQVRDGQASTYAHEHRLLRQDGTWLWVSSRGRLYQSDPQQPRVLVGTDVDITEAKQRQGELEQAIAEAEQAREIAVASSKAKSTFLTNVSHEIRTPMNAILGFSQLLMDDAALSENQRENLEIINSSGQHLLSLIDDILNLSRIESGHFKVRLEPANPSELFQEISHYYQKRVIKEGVTLRSRIAPDLPPRLLLDAKALRQVCMNLLSNAFKFTERGEVGFNVSLQHDGDPRHGRLVIEVCDAGMGIDAVDLDRIFNAFERSEAASVNSEGFGLGLTISKNIITQLGGRLQVQSELGKGSCFTALVPVETLPAAAPTPEEQPASRLHKVLVVDDIESNRKLLIRLLADPRLVIREASDAAAALEIIEQWSPALVLMDIRMPGLPGDEAIAQLRNDPRHAALGIIAITANTMEGERERLIAAGADDFISKPILKEEVYAKVARLLQLGDAMPLASPSVAPPATLDARQLSVLVVDDHQANRQLLTSQLRVLGLNAEVADNGRIGLESWQHKRHALVFADMAMPVMNGFAMAQAIRAMETEDASPTHTLIFAITGSPEEYRQRCLQAGIDEVLGKPILLHALGQTLRRHVTGLNQA